MVPMLVLHAENNRKIMPAINANETLGAGTDRASLAGKDLTL
jgi:hypothetical protein